MWMIFIVSKALENRRTKNNKARVALKTIGDYSYDIYLMHNPYVVAVEAIVCCGFLATWSLLVDYSHNIRREYPKVD